MDDELWELWEMAVHEVEVASLSTSMIDAMTWPTGGPRRKLPFRAIFTLVPHARLAGNTGRDGTRDISLKMERVLTHQHEIPPAGLLVNVVISWPKPEEEAK